MIYLWKSILNTELRIDCIMIHENVQVHSKWKRYFEWINQLIWIESSYHSLTMEYERLRKKIERKKQFKPSLIRRHFKNKIKSKVH